MTQPSIGKKRPRSPEQINGESGSNDTYIVVAAEARALLLAPKTVDSMELEHDLGSDKSTAKLPYNKDDIDDTSISSEATNMSSKATSNTNNNDPQDNPPCNKEAVYGESNRESNDEKNVTTSDTNMAEAEVNALKREARLEIETKKMARPIKIGTDEVEGLEGYLNNNNHVGHALGDAINCVEKARRQAFQLQNDNKPGGLLLNELYEHIDELNGLPTTELQSEKVDKIASILIWSISLEIGFDTNWDTTKCEKSDLSTLEDLIPDDGTTSMEEKRKLYNTNTLEALMKLQAILVEKKLVQDMILGKLFVHVRNDGTIALWARFPRRFVKFYCKGMMNKYKVKQRSLEFTMAKDSEYLVSNCPPPY